MNKLQLLLLVFLGGVTGCASNHHLVFFTNTTIGFEVGSEPSSGVPVKFILGYKRQEGVIDPLIPDYEFHKSETWDSTIKEPKNGGTNIVLTPAGVAAPKGSVTKPHSVLAKMNFGATGGGAGAAAAQWFATGKAAELLAQSTGISGALSGDSQNNSSPSILISKESGRLATFSYLNNVYEILTDSIEEGNESGVSSQVKVKIDQIDSGNFKTSFNSYVWQDNEKTKLVIATYDVKEDDNYFPNVIQYMTTMYLSYVVSEEAVIKQGVTVSGVPLTEEQKKLMLQAIKTYSKNYDEGVNTLSKNEVILEMINHVHKNVLLTASNASKEG